MEKFKTLTDYIGIFTPFESITGREISIFQEGLTYNEAEPEVHQFHQEVYQFARNNEEYETKNYRQKLEESLKTLIYSKETAFSLTEKQMAACDEKLMFLLILR